MPPGKPSNPEIIMHITIHTAAVPDGKTNITNSAAGL